MTQAAVRLVGWVHLGLCGIGLAAGVALCVSIGLSGEANASATLLFVGPLFLMLSLVYLIPGAIGGWGLLRGAAWARFLIGALSLLNLLVFPIGTVLGGLSLWVLFGPNAPKPAPPAPPKPAPPTPEQPLAPKAFTPIPVAPVLVERPTPQERRLIGLGLAMAFVAAMFIVVLGAGFRLWRQSPPGYLDEGFYPAIAVLVAIAAFVVIRRPFGPEPGRAAPLNPIALHRYRQRMKREQQAFMEARRQRLAVLAADPLRARYVPLIEAGQSWSDTEIAYDLDPDLLATCRHLQPIEQAMRRAGLPVKLIAPPQVRAPCRINEAALWAAFQPPASVAYHQYFMGGRHEEDDPVAFLICNTCKSTIDTLHFRDAPAGAPWFPEAPVGEGA